MCVCATRSVRTTRCSVIKDSNYQFFWEEFPLYSPESLMLSAGKQHVEIFLLAALTLRHLSDIVFAEALLDVPSEKKKKTPRLHHSTLRNPSSMALRNHAKRATAIVRKDGGAIVLVCD